MRRLRTAPKIFFPALLLGIAAFSGVIDLTAPPGPGLDPDALAYLGAGKSLATGHGLRIPSSGWENPDTTAPLVHFPPAFPAAIAIGVKTGASPIGAARFVEATAAAVTTIAMLLAANVAGGILATIIAFGILASTPALLVVHSGMLSEPLFLAILALFTWLMSRERRGVDKQRTLLLGALAAAATLTRYAGVSLVVAVVAEAWWNADGSRTPTWKQRAKRAMVAAEVPAFVLAIWVLTRPHSEGAEKIREVGIYTKGFGATLAGGADTFARWIAPGVNSDTARTMAALAVFAAVCVLIVRTIRAARHGLVPASELRSYRATAIILTSYIGVVLASRLLADPGIPLDNRILAPLFMVVGLRVAVAMASFLRASLVPHRGIALLTIGITASWMWGAEEITAAMIQDVRGDGGDLAAHEWSASQLVEWARNAPPGAILYSNWPAAIWFHTARATHELPSDLSAVTVRGFRAKIEREHGAMLSFNVPAGDYAPPDSLAKLAGLVAVERWPDGAIWRAPADTIRLHP